MKHLVKILTLGMAIAVAPLAHATPITASINFNGNDSFTTSTISFPANTGTATNQYIAGGSTLNGVTLAQFTAVTFASSVQYSPAFSNPAGFLMVTIPATPGNAAANIYVTNESGVYDVGTTFDTLTLTGTGFITESGYTQTGVAFTLTTQQQHGASTGTITGFSASSFTTAATPEPSSLIMLGTGLMSAAGMMVRRRKIS